MKTVSIEEVTSELGNALVPIKDAFARICKNIDMEEILLGRNIICQSDRVMEVPYKMPARKGQP